MDMDDLRFNIEALNRVRDDEDDGQKICSRDARMTKDPLLYWGISVYGILRVAT